MVVMCEQFAYFQDLPEFFEDNMSTWMAGFHALMVTDQKLLESDVRIYFQISILLLNFYIL